MYLLFHYFNYYFNANMWNIYQRIISQIIFNQSYHLTISEEHLFSLVLKHYNIAADTLNSLNIFLNK